MCRDLLALTSLFFTCSENLLSHWKVIPKISTSLQLGINPIGEKRLQFPLFLIVSSLYLYNLLVNLLSAMCLFVCLGFFFYFLGDKQSAQLGSVVLRVCLRKICFLGSMWAQV